jgi:hypothetical protein
MNTQKISFQYKTFFFLVMLIIRCHNKVFLLKNIFILFLKDLKSSRNLNNKKKKVKNMYNNLIVFESLKASDQRNNYTFSVM